MHNINPNITMNAEKANEFLSNYQSLLFEEISNDPYSSADVKRKCLVQNILACNDFASEDVACDILESKLKEYSDLVDDQSCINNYASSIQALTSHLNKTDCLKWQSDLSVSDIDDVMKSLTCCSDNDDVVEDELKILFEKKVQQTEPVKTSNFVTQVTRSIAPKSNVDNSSTSFKNPPKKFSAPKHIPCEETGTDNNINNQPAKRNNCGFFKTARDELQAQNAKKYGSKQNNNPQQQQPLFSYGAQKKSLGARRGVQSKFIPPVRQDNNSESNDNSPNWGDSEEVVDERLKNIDPRMVELIRSEIMDSSAPISWDDIAGLEFAKSIIKEVIVWPLKRPDIFTGLRRPPKGVLLFGPPGTGKTLIGKCIASQSQSTFFSISASSLTSKWIGDGEKMVRAMFAVAKCHQPAVIFIDEIDSLLSQRSDTEHESSRRIKTEFLVQLDGAATGEEDRILVIGATNRPQELDEAARRRFVKRLYIPLPEQAARLEIVKRLMSSERNDLTDENITEVADLSAGYSGADMKNLCAEASLGPIRSIDINMMEDIQADQVRPITMDDFKKALSRVRASVSSKDLDQYISWNKTYGAGGC